MVQLTFDSSLRTDLAPCAIDFTETSFFRSREASPNKPELPTIAEVRDRARNERRATVAFPELGLFVKYGPPHDVSIEEAQTLQAINRAFTNEQVPVPELVGWRAEGKISYIYMSLIPGSTLQSCWPTLTHTERTKIADQLARILATLRSVRQDYGTEYIGALDHGPVRAAYWRGDTVGPFPDVREFNDALQFWALPWLPMSKRPPDSYRDLLPDDAEICFSHGDLHLDNIMVSGTPGSRQISAIVDWGLAGWYPEFWEYYNMVIDAHEHEWSLQGWINVVLKSYKPEALALDTYWSWRGPA